MNNNEQNGVILQISITPILKRLKLKGVKKLMEKKMISFSEEFEKGD